MATWTRSSIYDAELTATEVASLYSESPTCTSPAPHHIEVTTGSSSGPSCTPVVYTIKACLDAACTSTYTEGLSGNLVLSGTPSVNYTPAFSIAPGSATTTVSAHVTTTGTVTAGLSGLSIAPIDGTSPYCGMGTGAASGGSCAYAATAAGLVFDVNHHAAESSQAITVRAVRSSDNASACTPAFASVTKNVTFKCTYDNPVTGTLPVRVGGNALNAANSAASACDTSGHAVSLNFNASGEAATTVQYADVGQMMLTATYTGSGPDAGLTMTGNDTFIAAPASFGLGSITPGPIAAGQAFSATLTARNTSGQTTPNFGRETSPATASLAFNKATPTGAGASDGSFSGSAGAFSNGMANANDLAWSEVGTGDLSVALNGGSYLGSGLNASGSTGSGGAVGPFVPHHFTTELLEQGCGSFTYSGQPFKVKIYAHNASDALVNNYDGTAQTSPNMARTVTLTPVSNGSLGNLSNATVSAASFVRGVATWTTPAFTFSSKSTGPVSVSLRASDTHASSAGEIEALVAIRSGRLRLSNAFGSQGSPLSMVVQAQYWSGKSWILSEGDHCTVVPTSAVALSGYKDYRGDIGAWTSSVSSPVNVANGIGSLTLSSPSPSMGGSVDVAINLGTSTADNACLSNHPATIGSAQAWLRSRNGSCSVAYDRDPSARATFGIYAPETRKMVHVRPLY